MHEIGSTVYPRQALGCVVVRAYNVLIRGAAVGSDVYQRVGHTLL